MPLKKQILIGAATFVAASSGVFAIGLHQAFAKKQHDAMCLDLMGRQMGVLSIHNATTGQTQTKAWDAYMSLGRKQEAAGCH